MQQASGAIKAYRPDIDGLRAIAVLAVIGFHLDVSLLAGGHIGVDVFFVLSGFLITSTITQKTLNKQFSIKTFYRQRINRLFPALLATVATTFIASLFVLLPNDFERLSLSSIAALFSASNFLFWSEAGYWDVSSNTKPLLHTWSLGVEEQFYLIYPLLLLFIFRTRINTAKFLLALTVLGAIICYFYTKADTSGAFFLLPARFFQFFIGGALAALIHEEAIQKLIIKKHAKWLLLCTGLGLILYACVAFGNTIYPGLYALAPSLGALLVILSGSSAIGQGYLGRIFLENPVCSWLGRISYSLYLTHWPIIVLYRYSTNEILLPLEVLALLTASIVTGALLHYRIEKKFYASRFNTDCARPKSKAQPRKTLVILTLGLIMAAISLHAWLNQGWPWRFENLSYSAEDIKAASYKRFAYFSKSCPVEKWPLNENCIGRDAKTILFFGNSHEPDGISFMQAGYSEALKKYNLVTFGTFNDCKNLLRKKQQWKSDNEHCQNRLNHLFDPAFVANIDIIIYSAHHTFLPHNRGGWEIMEDLKAINHTLKIITIGDYIETKTPCVKFLNETGSTENCFASDNISYAVKNVETQELYLEFSFLIDLYIDRLDLLCTSDNLASCLSESPQGVPYSFDKHHISLEFSEMSGRLYAKKKPTLFSDILNDPTTSH